MREGLRNWPMGMSNIWDLGLGISFKRQDMSVDTVDDLPEPDNQEHIA
jgi:hypothetical protein